MRLEELQERRAYECRLTPDRALETLDEAEAFLRDRALLTRTAGCSLPSLFEACHEEPYKPGAGGFGEWPRTKWWWSFELALREGVYAVKIQRGKTLYLSRETARIVNPICRAEIERMEAVDEGWARLLRHLGDTGPSLLEDVQLELGLEPRELKSLRSPLERCGAIVGRLIPIESDGGETYASEIARWDHVYPEPADGPDRLDDLVVAGVRAAVVVPEPEPKRWFSWAWRWEDDLVGRLVEDGRLERPEPGWLAAP